MRMGGSALAVAAGLALSGCTGVISTTPADQHPDASLPPADAGSPVDAGVPDAGVPDAGAPDAGVADAGAPDAGTDAGVIDAGDPFGTDGDGDFTVDTFNTQPELTDLGAAQGQHFTFSMDSTKSIIFDGGDPTLDPAKPRLLTRQIDVYVPARYHDGDAAPFMVIQDGPGPIDAISRAIDNLDGTADAGRWVPPFIAIGVQNGGNDAQGSERGLEYDTLSDRYARFIELEVLPAVLADANIHAAFPNLRFTSDPEGRTTYGCSSGAAAAFTMAWFRPDLFRRVVSYSGTFVAQQDNGQPEAAIYPLGAWDYHSDLQLVLNTPVKPLRVFLNVNEFDNGYDQPESGYHNWVIANQRMTDELGMQGYHRRFVLAKTLGHCDARAWQATLADTLVWLWRGYPH
jgi:iron(III)-enterobactin esterase